jgi:hypothetical protein
MKRIFLILFLFLALTSSATAGELWVRALSLTYPCTGDLYETEWVNEWGPIYIKQVTTWIGADKGSTTEINAAVYRASNWMAITNVGWDRYAPPTGLHQFTQTFSPDWIFLDHGDSLILQSWCKSFGKPWVAKPNASANAMFYYCSP